MREKIIEYGDSGRMTFALFGNYQQKFGQTYLEFRGETKIIVITA